MQRAACRYSHEALFLHLLLGPFACRCAHKYVDGSADTCTPTKAHAPWQRRIYSYLLVSESRQIAGRQSAEPLIELSACAHKCAQLLAPRIWKRFSCLKTCNLGSLALRNKTRHWRAIQPGNFGQTPDRVEILNAL